MIKKVNYKVCLTVAETAVSQYYRYLGLLDCTSTSERRRMTSYLSSAPFVQSVNNVKPVGLEFEIWVVDVLPSFTGYCERRSRSVDNVNRSVWSSRFG